MLHQQQSLSQLQDKENYERVKVTVTVLSVGSPVLAGVKNKQEITVVDDTATALVQLWENDVCMMKQDHSFVLNGFFGERIFLQQITFQGPQRLIYSRN